MDDIVLRGYKELLSVGKINNDVVYNHVVQGRITGDDYKIITGEDCPELPLDLLKQKKIEELWIECNKAITNGFYSDVSGETLLWGFDEVNDQNNLNQQLTMIACGLTDSIIYWKPKGDTQFVGLTIDQFKQLCSDAQVHKTSNMMRYFPLKETVMNATTLEEVTSIVW